MPTYEYICEKCGFEFDRFQSITAGTLRKCPECKAFALRRKIGSGSGIIFKGSGFYETDYRSNSYKAGERNEANAAPSSSSSGSSKSKTSSEDKPKSTEKSTEKSTDKSSSSKTKKAS